MTQPSNQKIYEIFSEIMTYSKIKYAEEGIGEAYVVYNDKGILFDIVFNRIEKRYIFNHYDLLTKELAKHGITGGVYLNPQTIFETVAFSYKVRKIAMNTNKDVYKLYQTTLIDSDVSFEMRKGFKTYVVSTNGIPAYAIGYNPQIKKCGFTRYELMKALYKICDINMDQKPDYPSLYKKTKDSYLAQIAVENIYGLEIE